MSSVTVSATFSFKEVFLHGVERILEFATKKEKIHEDTHSLSWKRMVYKVGE